MLSILFLNHGWFCKELRQRGHKVVFAGMPEVRPDIGFLPGIEWEELLSRLPKGFSPDRIVCVDNSAPLVVSGLERAPCPSIFFSIDSHHHAHWHKFYAKVFDGVLVAQKDFLPQFAAEHSSAEWFPLWAPTSSEPDQERSIDVCFRGTLDPRLHPRRKEFFDRLAKEVPVDAGRGAPKLDYVRAKIVINQAVRNDVNFRVFEALAAGAMLLTPKTANGLLELFEDGKEIVTYEFDSVQDAAHKIRYYLEHEEERRKIAERGNSKFRERHSLEKRCDDLERILLNLTTSKREQAQFASGYAHVLAGRVYEQVSEEFAVETFIRALNALEKSAELRERLDDEFFTAVAACQLSLGKHRPKEALEFSARIWKRFPSEPALQANFLDAMARYGVETPVMQELNPQDVSHLAARAGELGKVVEELVRKAGALRI